MRLYIKTHGCQMNEYDSDKIAALLQETNNAQVVDSADQADVILLNTCAIREKAQEKVFHELGRWKSLKQRNPELKIGVGGCVASQEGAFITERAPYVDLVFGPQTLHRVPDLLAQNQASGEPVVDISFPEIEKFDHLPKPHADGVTAYVTVMEGCSKYCSFCVVPYTRGHELSRPVRDVMREIVSLAKQGVREINLLGQNVNAYRGDYAGGKADLAELIHYVGEIEGIERIRYTTSHPIEFSNPLIDAYGSEPKLVNHLHLPVQSGSDRVLAMMKRGHTVLEYKSKIRRLREIRPDIALSSDFIVGYPGETERDFEQTCELVQELNFDISFSFIFSARPGTPAASLPDPVPQETKKIWLQHLQELLRQQATAHAENMVGSVEKVLVTGRSLRSSDEFQGRTENNRVVNFPGQVASDFVDVRITEALSNSLRGELINS